MMRLFGLLGTVTFVSALHYAELRNTQVTRTVSLKDSVAESSIRIQMQNLGKEPVDSFHLLFDNIPFDDGSLANADRLGFLRVTDDDSKSLKWIMEEPEKQEDFSSCRVVFDKPLPAGATYSVYVFMIYGRAYNPLPKKIRLMDQQLTLYTDRLKFFSPYVTDEDTIKVKLLQNFKLERHGPQSGQVKGNTISFGTNKKIKPFSGKELVTVHFYNPLPQPYFSSVFRDIEVSHWGSVSFREEYTLHNGGAELSSEFSRIPFIVDRRMQHGSNPYSLENVLEEIDAVLPRHARMIDYRDEIGNISTSHARRETAKRYTSVQLKPRYPMFGGWNAFYEMSYDLPVKTCLQVSKDDPSVHVLSVAFNHPFPRVFAHKLSTHVVLPEGAYDIKVNTPRPVDEYWTDTTYRWLDSPLFGEGRPVVGVSTNGFYVPEKEALNYKFQVVYKISRTAVLGEPFLLFGYIFVLFVAYIVANRFSLKIARSSEKKDMDTREKLDSAEKDKNL